MEWLPEFSLSPTECEKMDHSNAVKFIRRAAKVVYSSDKFKRRGEFGELLLHIAIRQVFGSLPAVSKIYYKTATNDPIKGFDAVHVVATQKELELWIGEAKFYSDIGKAIKDVVEEVEQHTQTDYLRSEFALILNKIDDAWPHASVLKKLLDPATSLDVVFARACIPVLLTYDSPTVACHHQCDSSYRKAFEEEISKNYTIFSGSKLPKELRIHLFLLPLFKKERLVRLLDERLKRWQQL